MNELGKRRILLGLQAASYLSIAAGLAVGAGYPMAQTCKTARSRVRPEVQRMVTSESEEIKAWNAAVDARKAAKKNRA